MAYQAVFKRYELKYMLTGEQKKRLLSVMEQYMLLDKYGRTTIRNLYFDTENYRLIRKSIEKPCYKEKLRVRSYQTATKESMVFVELKKKHDGIVYKRRLSMPEQEAEEWLSGEKHCREESQIAKEIDYVLAFYGSLHPAVFLSYEREAYYSRDGSDFRVTFDDTILCREEDLSLQKEAYGKALLEKDAVLMEIKCSGGIPLWMTEFLSKERIYKTSYSKYGTAYRTMIYPKKKEREKKEDVNNGFSGDF